MKLRISRALIAVILFAATISSCKQKGCTDSSALNYFAEAEVDDGSCVYINRERETVSLSGFYSQHITLVNLNTGAGPNGLENYDYRITENCEFHGGLTVEPGVRIFIFEGKHLVLGDEENSFLGTAEEPIYIKGSSADLSLQNEETLLLNGSTTIKHVQMESCFPILEDIVSLIFSDNTIEKVAKGFDFISGPTTGSTSYLNPDPFVDEFERNSFSVVFGDIAAEVPMSMFEAISASNNFDIEDHQYVQVGKDSFQSIPPWLKGNHTWSDLGVNVVVQEIQVGSASNPATLTLEPGFSAKMNDCKISVHSESTVVCEGTNTAPISLERYGNENWSGFLFQSGSTGRFSNITIDQGGANGSAGNIEIRSGGSVEISNSTVSNSSTCGIQVFNGGTLNEGGNMMYHGNVFGNVCD